MLLDSSIRQESKKFLQLAIPLASAQVAQSLTGFFDTIMMGRLGAETLAGGGLASLTFFAILNIATAIVMAVSPLIAEAHGAKNKKRIETLARQGFWLSWLLTIPIMFAIAHCDSIMLRLGQPEVIVELADSYLDIILWGSFPAVGFAMLRGVVSGLSHARPVMYIVVSGTIFNIIGNYVLSFGKFGFPRLELAGLALASIITLWGMFVTLLIYIFKHPQLKNYRILKQFHRLNLPVIWELCKIGFPIGIFVALEIGLFTTVTYLMGRLGTQVLAAHQIVFQTILIIFMIPLGMSYAATVRVGQWLGQKNLKGIERAGYLSISVGLVFAIAVTIIMLLFPQAIVSLYIDVNDPANTEIVNLALPMLTIATVSQILDAVQKITYGALQGLQDTRIPILLNILAFWIIGITSGFLLGFHFGLGGRGLWLGQSIGVAVAALLFWIRWRQKLSHLKTVAKVDRQKNY
ncbi:MATE family efflux transporter [Pleurocapsales cyanobacterium LEGE 10410]|nr:MATE family efflux transporter [Pleurocapsales cyanobacterium LEGE 10410]